MRKEERESGSNYRSEVLENESGWDPKYKQRMAIDKNFFRNKREDSLSSCGTKTWQEKMRKSSYWIASIFSMKS